MVSRLVGVREGERSTGLVSSLTPTMVSYVRSTGSHSDNKCDSVGGHLDVEIA